MSKFESALAAEELASLIKQDKKYNSDIAFKLLKQVNVHHKVSSKRGGYTTYLHLACFHGRIELVEALIKAGCKDDVSMHESCIEEAAQGGHLEVVRELLLWKGVRTDGKVMLYHIGLNSNNNELVEMALKNKVPVNLTIVRWQFKEPLKPAIHLAIQLNRLDVVKQMEKVFPACLETTNGEFASWTVAAQYSHDIFDYLMTIPALVSSINFDSDPLLVYHLHSASNSDAFVQKAMKYGFSCTARTSCMDTVLHYVNNAKQAQWIYGMVKTSISIEYANTYGVTPLMEACRAGRTHVVRYLLEIGAIPSAAALGYAVENGHNSCVEVLLQYKADPNAYFTPTRKELIVPYEKYTYPILAATALGYYNMIELLAKYNANLNVQNHRGNSAIVIAKTPSIRTLLHKCGAAWHISEQDAQTLLKDMLSNDSQLDLLKAWISSGICVNPAKFVTKHSTAKMKQFVSKHVCKVQVLDTMDAKKFVASFYTCEYSQVARALVARFATPLFEVVMANNKPQDRVTVLNAQGWMPFESVKVVSIYVLCNTMFHSRKVHNIYRSFWYSDVIIAFKK